MRRVALIAGGLGLVFGLITAPYLPSREASAQANDPAPAAQRTGGVTAAEQSTIDIFQNAQNSVVFITTTMRGMEMFLTMESNVPRGTGSGFVWDESGYVVTNAHVLSGSNGASVRLPGGRAIEARVVGVDERHDLAVLQVPSMGGMRPFELGRSADLQVGQNVYAIGNPFGLDFTLTTGVVSALGRDVPGQNGVTIRSAIQTDAAINPGNSGGPLLDSSGRLIGVNTAIFSPSGASAGIGFAIPVDAVRRVVPQLIARGRYSPPALGVSGDPRADAILRSSGQPPGVVVLGVLPGGPAEAAGLQPAQMTANGFVPGDVIEAIDGEPVATLDDLLAQLDRHVPGDRVTLRLRNGRDRRDVAIELAAGG